MIITKNDLENFKKNEDYIKKRKIRIQDLLEQTQKITASYKENYGHSIGGLQDKMAENLSTMLDMQREVLEDILKQEKKLIYIEQEINKLEPKYRNILYSYYIEGKDLVKVAVEEGYDYAYTCKLNRTSISEVAEKRQ